MARLKPLMSSERQDWQTPDCVLERVRAIAPIGLDPCTTAENPVGASIFYTPGDDGLSMPWEVGDEGTLVYCNPPYLRGEQSRWIRKCDSTLMRTVVALLPARTDTRHFPWTADMLCFWRGRLKFRGAPAPAPFPSVLALWTADATHGDRFAWEFRHVGKVIRP
jgi:hypothetical protein